MESTLEIKNISINKINKRFEKKYGDNFDTYYWKVKLVDLYTPEGKKKTYRVKASISKDYIRELCITSLKFDKQLGNQGLDIELAYQIREKIKNYLIENKEAYLGEDGDLYLIGE